VESLQEQRVWYSRTSHCSPEGLPVSQPSPVGWQWLEAMTGSDSAELAKLKSLQLVITRAPAEWTLPTKTDRQFTPTFEVEVRAQLAISHQLLTGQPPVLHAALADRACTHASHTILARQYWLLVPRLHAGLRARARMRNRHPKHHLPVHV
jgi:hypothetical protein